jgi:hypothetical protein
MLCVRRFDLGGNCAFAKVRLYLSLAPGLAWLVPTDAFLVVRSMQSSCLLYAARPIVVVSQHTQLLARRELIHSCLFPGAFRHSSSLGTVRFSTKHTHVSTFCSHLVCMRADYSTLLFTLMPCLIIVLLHTRRPLEIGHAILPQARCSSLPTPSATSSLKRSPSPSYVVRSPATPCTSRTTD